MKTVMKQQWKYIRQNVFSFKKHMIEQSVLTKRNDQTIANWKQKITEQFQRDENLLCIILNT